MIYFCAQSSRRELVLQSPALNGVDYLEVLGAPGCGTQLAVTFLKNPAGLNLGSENIALTGGTAVSVTDVLPAGDQDPLVLLVNLNQTGDFSAYTLTLISGPDSTAAPIGVDPALSSVQFSFKAGCPSPADCVPSASCPVPSASPPDINYLAKDYGGFLQVIQDRIAVLLPTWTEAHAADLGVALTEVLAYAADHLSYQQDAVSTEAYLATARSRISLRRHARLVDYHVGEGHNARTLVSVTTTQDNVELPAGTLFYAGSPGVAPAALAGDASAQRLAASTAPVFSAMQDTVLYLAHNEIQLYTWSGSECCLPAGATQATLLGNLIELAPGHLLIFEEVLGPDTGQTGDADPTHRCAVALTAVTVTSDPLNGTAITEISWAQADALPFPLCISSQTDAEHGAQQITGVSVGRANVVPADHGVYIDAPEALGTVPALPPSPVSSGCGGPAGGCGCGCSGDGASQTPVARFYPSLAQAPLTFSTLYSVPPASASAFLNPGTAGTSPTLTVSSDDGHQWSAQTDLLTSPPDFRGFVPEIESDGTVFLRFGDNEYGMAPDPGLSFSTLYRVGNGSSGNIGRDTLAHAVLPTGWMYPTAAIGAVRNPLAASGGVDPEDAQHIAAFAPFAYQTQQRCVTEADYGIQASALTGGLEAKGTMRWTGSWYTAFVSIDPTELTPAVALAADRGLDLRRMLGTDVAVEAAVIVGLQIVLDICVDGDHLQGDVYTALMQRFVTGEVCDGTPGILSPSTFTFGQTVYASPLVAAAQSVPGVISVALQTFTRMDQPWVDGVSEGYLTFGALEIPRCDNDPDHLDHGSFVLQMDGGR